MKLINVAIDGPAGAGKSTVARIVAEKLNFTYVDTGAMYRAIAWLVLNNNVAADDHARIEQYARAVNIKLLLKNGTIRTFVNNTDITEEIRTQEVSRLVADIAQLPSVRDAMVELQRKMATFGGVVMDGRDICTNVLPNAEVKIFLTASITERAKRRWLELTQKGVEVNLTELEAEIALRDKKDSEREFAPLIKATDALLIDTTDLSIEDTVESILMICRERMNIV